MKRYIIILLLFLLGNLGTEAQNQYTGNGELDAMIGRLHAFGQRIPQEKVYLHMDNTCYFLGDTIWFAAYTRTTNNDLPSSVSRVLYVELLNQDGYLMERQLVEMQDGRGHGNFALSKDYYGGYYELRAYTRWQLNWGRFQHQSAKVSREWFINDEMHQLFYRDYDKLYSRTFPVYDAPKLEGDYSEDMTLRPMRRYYKKEADDRELRLSFYPEGGNLTEGLPCRIAFEAAWEDGEAVEGTLQDFNVPTRNRGRATFEFTPQAGEEREVTFVASNGRQVKAKLPKAEKEGVAVKAERTDEAWRFDIALSDGLSKDSIGVTLMYEGNLQQVFTLRSARQSLEIPLDKLREGVHQLTIFDASGRVWADRLFFVSQPSASTDQARVSIEDLKPQYAPYEQVRLGIRSDKPGAQVSLAVRDMAHSDNLYDNATIRTEMLLASEVKGFIPDPEWFFREDDEEHREALDLLMMTQGWRRFNWRDMAVRGEWDLTEPAEKSPILKGQVYRNSSLTDEFYEDEEFVSIVAQDGIHSVGAKKASDTPPDDSTKELPTTQQKKYELYRIGLPRKKGEQLVHIELASLDGKDVLTAEGMTTDGHFQLQLPGYYGDAVLFLGASDSTRWKKKRDHIWVEMAQERETPEFAVRLNQPYPRFVKPYDYYQQQLRESADPLMQAMLLGERTRQLNEVRVGARRGGQRRFSDANPAFMLDAYEAYNFAIDAGMMGPSLSTTESLSPEGIVRAYVGDYGMENPFVTIVIGDNTALHSNIEVRFAYNQDIATEDGQLPPSDSLYRREKLSTIKPFSREGQLSMNMTPKTIRSYYQRAAQDRFVIYTDYQPRLAGDKRYQGSDLPETQLAIYIYPDGSERAIYRDRRYIHHGYAYADDFYHPDYGKRKTGEKPKDYRRTLYWNPSLQLDQQGRAEVRFYNNAKQTQLSISAEGMAQDGTMLTN